MNPNAFAASEIDGVYRAIRERRDMRHFLPTPIPPDQLERFIRVWTLGTGVGYGRYPHTGAVLEGGHLTVSLDPKEGFCGCGGKGLAVFFEERQAQCGKAGFEFGDVGFHSVS